MGRPRTVGLQHPEHQVLIADPGMVELVGLAGSTIQDRPDLPGMTAISWEVRAGEDRSRVGMGDRPRLHGLPRPHPTAGGRGHGGWEVVGGADQLQDPLAGDTQQAGGLGGRDELRIGC
jgi:hypothetical protein